MNDPHHNVCRNARFYDDLYVNDFYNIYFKAYAKC